MKTTVAAIVLPIVLCAMTAVAGPVTVTNVTAAQRTGEPIVDIAYALLNPSGGLHNVAIEVSTNSGAWYVVWDSAYASGDIGSGISTGTHKQIVWNAAADLPNYTSQFAHVRVRANDENVPWIMNSMALIPVGPFQMGTNNLPYDDQMSDAGPNHTVTLSAFYMDKYEVTSQQWFEVRNWAMTNGYTFGAGSGKAANHPAQSMNWYDCVKWCNARSEKEGLTPCYYTNAAQTLVYRGGSANLSNEWVKWSASGYRLPTEAEWEKAGRGGAVGMRFPWNDVQTISRAQANYFGNTNSYAYDLGPNGYNPLFTTGGEPYTSPVGYFAPNGYGLYDMAGNVFEWCWDWYGSTYYASSPSSNPTGPATGTDRVLRGGCWSNYARGCRVAGRNGDTPGVTYYGIGFRCVRGL